MLCLLFSIFNVYKEENLPYPAWLQQHQNTDTVHYILDEEWIVWSLFEKLHLVLDSIFQHELQKVWN